MAGGVVPMRMVIATDTGFVKANCLSKSKGYGGYLELIEGWVRNVLAQWSGRIEWVQLVKLEQLSYFYSVNYLR